MGDSECREMYEDGRSCSCHLNPPCSFCVSMDEEEADAYHNDGTSGLVELWERRDAEAKEELGKFLHQIRKDGFDV